MSGVEGKSKSLAARSMDLTVTRLTDGEKDYVDYFVDCNEQYSKDNVVEGTLKIELK